MLPPFYYSPIPSTRHQSIALKFAAALLRHVETRKLGQVLHAPCNVVLSREIVIQPDILFVEKKRIGIIGASHLRGAPNLVIEVLSPGAGKRNPLAKRRIYARFHVPEYWAVDLADNTVETLLWSEMGYISAGCYTRSDRLSSPLLPELNLSLSRIFRK